MELTTVKEPPGTSDMFARAMQIVRREPNKFSAMGGALERGSISRALPHPVFTIPLDKIADGLRAARESGMRLLLTSGEDVVGAFSMGMDPARDKPTLQAVTHEGPFVGGVEAALRVAESEQGRKSPSYQLRLLQVPALHLLSLWLHGDNDNLFVPVNRASTPLEPNHLYTEQEFFEPLPVAAYQSARVVDNAPKGEPFGTHAVGNP